jgi:(2Fe-2S) ferredoxin
MRFSQVVATRGLGDLVELSWQSCFGRCRQGPNVLVRAIAANESRFLFAMFPSGGQNAALYNGVREEDCERIVEEHVVNGRIVRELVRRPDAEGAIIPPAGSGEPGGGKDPK